MARRHWGAGSIRQEANGSWSAVWSENRRRRFKGGFPNKALAERFLAVHKGVLAYRGAGVMPDPKALPTIGELAKDFLSRRENTHKAGLNDAQRWALHQTMFDSLRPAEVDTATIRRWVKACRDKGLAGSSIRVMLATLSGLFTELQEEGLVHVNPAKGLPPSIRLMLRTDSDPMATPFIERLDDVHRIFLALPEEVARPFAVCAYAGLRPGEALALNWRAVDFERRTIHVTEQVSGVLKDRQSRPVPILDVLLPRLKAWHLEAGGKGLVCRPPGAKTSVHRLHREVVGTTLARALADLGLAREGLGWYESTRHTFASHWVLRGGNVAQLSKILGHSSVRITERYMHLRPDLFPEGGGGIFGEAKTSPGVTFHLSNSCHSLDSADQGTPPAIRQNR